MDKNCNQFINFLLLMVYYTNKFDFLGDRINVMKIHVFTNENPYNRAFLMFLHKNFDLDQHLFVFRVKKSNSQYPEELNENIIYAHNFLKLIKLTPKFLSSQRIFFHYLPFGPSLFYWTPLSFIVPQKLVWIFWGGDIYFFRKRPKIMMEKLYECFRKLIIGRINYIAGFLEGDFNIIKENYFTKAKYYYTIYPLPVDYANLDSHIINEYKIEKKSFKILLGNSADKSNNHIEILQYLKRFENTDFIVYCPLSYAGEKDYKENVIRKGKELLGDKFVPLLNFMEKDQYASFLNSIDIAIMNQDRQQGLGNILPLLYLGKKVYIREEITTFKYFENKLIKVYKVKDLESVDFISFSNFDKQIGDKNKFLIKSEFSDENYFKIWNNILKI